MKGKCINCYRYGNVHPRGYGHGGICDECIRKAEIEAREERERAEREREARTAEILAPAQSLLNNGNFFEADSFIRTQVAERRILPELLEKYEEEKSKYIELFFKEKFNFNAGDNKKKLSAEQFLAISDISQNLLLRARAGSGKTTTLSSKIAHLIHGEKVEHEKIIALCFNAEAAKNIIEKLEDDFAIKYREKENIATFHSLAHQISPPEEEVKLLFDERNTLGKQELTNFIEKILEKKWDYKFADLRNEEISRAPDSIFGFIKRFLTSLKYAEYKHVVYAMVREDKRLDTDEEADELEKRGIEFGSEEHYLYRRNLSKRNISYITLDGRNVKSFGEKCIADYLFEHDIKYKYEPNFRMGSNGRVHTYHPDFKLYEYGIIIEHWGVDEFDKQERTPKHWRKTWGEYVNEMKEKRDYWKTYNKLEKNKGKNYRLLETNITQLRGGREEFEEVIFRKLHSYGVNKSRLPLDKIIKNMSHDLRSRFSEKLVSYIQKAKQGRYSPEEMKKKIKAARYNKYGKVNVFLNLANIVYEQYEKDKKGQNKVDFYDPLINAKKKIDESEGNCKLRSGVRVNEIRWLLIDEFQDFSPLFLALIESIQKYNPEVKLFCVGDDWQAINSFAGSDAGLFNRFDEIFPDNSAIKYLTVNQRSNGDIVNFGNRIMVDRGVQSSANPNNLERGIIETRNINQDINQEKFDINAKKDDFNAKDASVVLLRYLDCTTNIIEEYLRELITNKKFKLLILSRKKKIGKYTLDDFSKKIEHFLVKKYFEDESNIRTVFSRQTDEEGKEYRQVESKTAHESKGLQANVVIVIEATNRCFPLIHPDSLLFEIFGDNINKVVDEERRLFYVACTRAESDLYLLYEKDFDNKKTLTEFFPVG